MVCAAADGDVVRPEAVHQLVHQDVREERVERDASPDRPAAARSSRSAAAPCSNLASCTFFSITRLVPFSRDDALVVGQVVGGGLHAAVAVAGGEDLVDDADRRERAELRVAVARIDRQVVLELLQVIAERLQLLRLGLVADGDERLERRLEVEPLVLVDLVRADGRLDRARRAPSTRRRSRSSRC